MQTRSTVALLAGLFSALAMAVELPAGLLLAVLGIGFLCTVPRAHDAVWTPSCFGCVGDRNRNQLHSPRYVSSTVRLSRGGSRLANGQLVRVRLSGRLAGDLKLLED